MKRFLFALVISLLPPQLAVADSLNDQAKKLAEVPHPKVFRSVLNERPRMLVITLDKTHAIAYDTWHSMLGCAWTVESGALVELDGAVYNGNHGPQPTRNGTTLFENNNAEFSSTLGTVHYLGHAFQKGKTIIRFGVRNEQHKLVATIEELPQWNSSTLKRSLRVLPEQMGSKITFTPAAGVQWKKAQGPFTKGTLSKPLTISTTL